MDGTKRAKAAGRLNGSLLNGGQQRRSVRDEELSRLEDEIKKAYAMKALHAQLAEQEATRMAASIQRRIADEIARCRAETEAEELDRRRNAERQRRLVELKTALERQVVEKHEERILLEEEERRERQLLVEVDRVREEREECEKARNKEQLAEQLLFEGLIQREMREIDKQKLKELEEEESVKNDVYIAQLEKRAERLKKLRFDAQKKREEAIATVAKMLLELQNEKNERRRLLVDLMIEEVKYDAEIEAREAELRRRERMRDFAEGLEEQIRFEEDCRRRFMEREKEFAEAILSKIMESEKMDRLTAEMKRRRRQEYREELERLMKERERAHAEELDRLRAALEEERRREEMDREEGRKARILLLEQHVDNIADFMSRKTLYDEEREIVDDSQRSK